MDPLIFNIYTKNYQSDKVCQELDTGAWSRLGHCEVSLPRAGGSNEIIFNVPLNPNHSGILGSL